MNTSVRILIVSVLLLLVIGFGLLRVYWDQKREPLFSRAELVETFINTTTVPGLIIGSIGVTWIMCRHRGHQCTSSKGGSARIKPQKLVSAIRCGRRADTTPAHISSADRGTDGSIVDQVKARDADARTAPLDDACRRA